MAEAATTNTQSEVPRVNCGVSEDGDDIKSSSGKVLFSLNEELAGCHISFSIQEHANGTEYGLLEIKKDDQLIRQYTSETFPKGDIKYLPKKNELRVIDGQHVYKVKLEKKKGIKLSTFFK